MNKLPNGKQVNTSVVVASLQKEAQPLLNKLGKLNAIKTKEQYEMAGTTLKELKAFGKQGKDKMDSIINPIEQAVKEIKELFKPFFEKVANTDTDIKEAMIQFLNSQDGKAKLIAEKLDAGKLTAATYFKQLGDLNIEVEGVSVRTKKVLMIKNPKRLPPKYLMPNEKLIKEDLLKGKVISGCKLVEEKILAL